MTPIQRATERLNERAPGEPRIVWLRRMVCTMTKILVNRVPHQDGYIDAGEVLHQIELFKHPLEPAPSMEEIKEACDIIDGTSTNGGGALEYKEAVPGKVSHIKYMEAPSVAPALGEIGSPIVGHSMPVGGFNGRFPGLGPQGF